jgi:hypothetical protein
MPDPILKVIADNPALLEAVRGLFLEKFSTDDLSPQMSNEVLGQKVRARLEGLAKVEEVFKEIEKCGSVEKKKEGVNPAR